MPPAYRESNREKKLSHDRDPVRVLYRLVVEHLAQVGPVAPAAGARRFEAAPAEQVRGLHEHGAVLGQPAEVVEARDVAQLVAAAALVQQQALHVPRRGYDVVPMHLVAGRAER
ncbi:hypothetical protein [Chitinimonas sp. JJ19]|uniref:hypothetical protein n=1 Tax=Chitinimonas sp. JJ19 TaxID=3109352 RepID=UPI0030022F30